MKKIFILIINIFILLFISSCNNKLLESNVKNIESDNNLNQEFEILDYNLFNGDELIFLKHQEPAQMMSVIFKTKNNKIIVFDGGRKGDANFLVNVINSYNINTVDAWFISHIHDDHIGALLEVIENFREKLYIKNIYYKFADINWYYEKMGDDAGYVNLILYYFNEYKKYCEQKNLIVNFHDNIKKFDKYIIDDVSVNVINDLYLLDSDPINNTSIVYRMDVLNKKVMILGDIGWYGGDAILKSCDINELKSDVVILSHHGQNGCGYELYEAIAPQYALWPTTKYIYENVDNIYKTNETIEWMDKLKVINILGFKANYILK